MCCAANHSASFAGASARGTGPSSPRQDGEWPVPTVASWDAVVNTYYYYNCSSGTSVLFLFFLWHFHPVLLESSSS